MLLVKKFIKTPHHFKNLGEDTEGLTINIETNGQTLEEITEAFNKFLTSCGFQVEHENEWELKELTLEELEEFTAQERLNDDDEEDS